MKLGFARTLFALAAAVASLVAADAVWRAATRWRFNPDGAPEYRCDALDVIAVHIALLEKPGARTALLSGERVRTLAPLMENAGVSCRTEAEGDAPGSAIVFASGAKGADWRRLSRMAEEDGAMAWLFSIRGLDARRFRSMLESFPCADAHLWMVGEEDWLLTGRKTPSRVPLSDALESFAPGDSELDLADAFCYSLPELFACYAGTRDDVMPAFAGALDAQVRPEFFLTKEIPAVAWLDVSGVDGDIAEDVMHEIRSMQVVRRVIVSGSILAAAGDPDRAVEKWAGAALRNPHDPMLLDRMYRLAVNASAFEKIGNIVAAAKCYETMVSVRPSDVAALKRYAACMARLGRKDVAEAAQLRALELSR